MQCFRLNVDLTRTFTGRRCSANSLDRARIGLRSLLQAKGPLPRPVRGPRSRPRAALA
jgi:hypothetical protein